MEEMRKLKPDEMENISGGVWRTVDTGVSGLNAALRNGPSKGSKQIASLPNKTQVDTVTDQVVYDPVSGRNYVKVTVNGQTGWIAASIIGLPR